LARTDHVVSYAGSTCAIEETRQQRSKITVLMMMSPNH